MLLYSRISPDHNFCKKKEIGKNKNKFITFRERKVCIQKITIAMIYISFKNLLTQNGLAYAFYTNLVEAMIRPEKLRLTYLELRSSRAICKRFREFSTSGVIFAVNSNEYFMKNNIIRTFRGKP